MTLADFLSRWEEAARITAGLFWMAFWAFGLGYLISSVIQVFVTRQRMRESLGRAGPRSMALATFFGFISSSCSFAALATTRALFAKGAGLGPSLAFLLSSTNLVVELGIVIAVFLSWQFVVGEYLGGLLLILLMWLLVRVTARRRFVEAARERAQAQEGGEESEPPDWRRLIREREGWRRVAGRYVMEWGMVWKDVTIGFTVAGIIAAFVPRRFFEWLFIGDASGELGLLQLLQHAAIGPVAAFFTFIGSMGNIPLAAVLFSNGVSYAGVMAFIFSDLVVFPVLRIQASYYGWRFALYVAAIFLVALIATTVAMHYGFAALGMLPDPADARSVTERTFFALDYTFVLNLAFLTLSAMFAGWRMLEQGFALDVGATASERVLFVLAMIGFLWIASGWLIAPHLG
jgi:uncharacterized membrane protein YraQ (UPF0718 family)